MAPLLTLPRACSIRRESSYNPRASVLTYMDGYRLVSVQPHRITVAKADDIVDAWRTLEDVRKRVVAACPVTASCPRTRPGEALEEVCAALGV